MRTRLMQALRGTIVLGIPLAAMAVLMIGIAYALVQQAGRLSADDPQLQMATDARDALNGGASPTGLVAATPIDLARSAAPFLIIYDAQGHALASSATLYGAPPVPPAGVFQSARDAGIDRVTWMPDAHVRSAAVILPWKSGYVLAGRSLRFVEDRADRLLRLALFGMAGTIATTFVLIFVLQFLLAPTKALAERHAATQDSETPEAAQ